jgi:alpha-beta hydrolase superfamily lysophospholipase
MRRVPPALPWFAAIGAAALLGAAPAAAAQLVQLKAEDGTAVSAQAGGAAGLSKGVVLVHMEGREASDWDYLADKLHRSQLRTVAPTLRKHGAAAAAGAPTEADWPKMEQDVMAAVAWLRAQGVKEVSCMGAGIGANLCTRVAAGDPAMVNLVLLSPGLKINGVSALDAMTAYGDRPALIVASADDRYAAVSADKMASVAQGQVRFELLPEAGRGTKMLSRDPSLEGTVLSWLLGTYELASGEIVRPRPAQTNAIQKIEVEGKKFGEQD